VPLVEEALKRGRQAGVCGYAPALYSFRWPRHAPDFGRDQRRTDSGRCRESRSARILINNAGVDLHNDLSDRANLERTSRSTFSVRTACRSLPAADGSFSRSDGQCPIVGGLGECAIHSGLFGLEGSCVLADAIAARTLGWTGREGSCRLRRPVDTDMTRYLDIPKFSPESVARGILDSLEKGDEDIFPDPMSSLSPRVAHRRNQGAGAPVHRLRAAKLWRRLHSARLSVTQEWRSIPHCN